MAFCFKGLSVAEDSVITENLGFQVAAFIEGARRLFPPTRRFKSCGSWRAFVIGPSRVLVGQVPLLHAIAWWWPSCPTYILLFRESVTQLEEDAISFAGEQG